MNRTDTIEGIQTLLGVASDGVWGPKSQKALSDLVSEPTSDFTLPANGSFDESKLINLLPAMMRVTQDGVEMIVYLETGGRSYYERSLAKPSWPVATRDWDNPNKNKSGVTIGVGYDLGQETSFESDWRDSLDADTFSRLRSAVGLKRREAQAKAKELQSAGISIPWEVAMKVFTTKSLPRIAVETERAYPNINNLHPNAQAAIMSMVYQWGPSIRLSAQATIRSAIASADYRSIASGLRSMKGLASNDGARRELEARYIELALS
jgi:hypothetical protein